MKGFRTLWKCAPQPGAPLHRLARNSKKSAPSGGLRTICPAGHPRDEGLSVCCQPIGAIFTKAALIGATLI
jgi:hypothetical protein